MKETHPELRQFKYPESEAAMEPKTDFKIQIDGVDSIRADLLETFQYEGSTQYIKYMTHEFSAVCPFSGLPDLGTLEIEYEPSDRCIELKSLKLYLISYRNVGIFQEHATNRLFKDVWNLLTPVWLRVTTKYVTRGGIDAICIMEQGERHRSITP
jgi:7-cyano-7-deazaguanine reductase